MEVQLRPPIWSGCDPQRFPLTVDEAGNGLPIPSTFGENTRAADARAFASLMKHLRQADAAEQTVIMVQVENEVGLPDSSRDRSPVAQAAFMAPVPTALTDLLVHHRDKLTREFRAAWEAAGSKTSGSWPDIFGSGPVGNELFMTWHYARYVGSVAAAGKAEYPLPFFVNAAIGRHDGKIGSYPGGGALPLGFNLWQVAAPAIEILSPDIYYGSFPGWCEAYAQAGNPFFIPETMGGDAGAAHAFLAIGRWNAIGVSPFAIDDHPPADDQFVLGLTRSSRSSALDPRPPGRRPRWARRSPENHDSPAQTIALGDYLLKVVLRRARKSTWVAENGYLLALAEQPNRFIVAGTDVQVYQLPPGGRVRWSSSLAGWKKDISPAEVGCPAGGSMGMRSCWTTTSRASPPGMRRGRA